MNLRWGGTFYLRFAAFDLSALVVAIGIEGWRRTIAPIFWSITSVYSRSRIVRYPKREAFFAAHGPALLVGKVGEPAEIAEAYLHSSKLKDSGCIIRPMARDFRYCLGTATCGIRQCGHRKSTRCPVTKVIVPDLWGHGQSGRLPESTHTLGDLATHAGRLLDVLGIEQCAIVGLSVGGMWGSELALRDPGRVKCLVMMDTDRGAEPNATLEKYSQMFDAIESLGSIPAPMIDVIVPLFFRRGATLDGEVHARFRQALAGFSADQLRQTVVPLGRIIFGRSDALASLASLDGASTLLMCGELDIPRPPAEMARMAAVIGCRQMLIPDAGHISNLENQSFVTDALLAWLGQHVA